MLGTLIVWWPASFWLQWTMAEGTVHILTVLQSSQPNPQRNKRRKMYAIKQINICAEYRDMLPRPRRDLSGTPRLRPIRLSPGSWQTSLGLGSMSRYYAQILICIMTSSNGNIFRVTGPLCGELTGHRWIPLTKASDAELWCFLWTAPVQTVQ